MQRQGEIESPRFLWVAALTIATSLVAVLAIRAAAVRILAPSPTFEPLALAPPIVDTTICTIVAILVFLHVSSYPNGVKKWRYVATAVLALSFIPDVLLAMYRSMGGGWPEACALMVMHIVVWAICITLLPGLAFTTRSSTRDGRDDGLSILWKCRRSRSGFPPRLRSIRRPQVSTQPLGAIALPRAPTPQRSILWAWPPTFWGLSGKQL